MDKYRELIVVCPVYNESGDSLRALVREWEEALDRELDDWEWVFIDDGSTRDDTRSALEAITRTRPRFCCLRTASHQGHGRACIFGYRSVCPRAHWILQIDSDGQCRPGNFPALWKGKADGFHQFGVRFRREDGRLRSWISLAVRLYLRLATGVWHPDPNCPFRLLYAPGLPPYLDGLPFNLANMALALRLTGVSRFCRIGFASRRTGRSSHKIVKSLASLWELRRLTFPAPEKGSR